MLAYAKLMPTRVSVPTKRLSLDAVTIARLACLHSALIPRTLRAVERHVSEGVGIIVFLSLSTKSQRDTEVDLDD